MISLTITGADDAVNPRDMVELSAEFPFLEWGILLSQTRMGTTRYPCPTWIYGLYDWCERLKLSAHLCGQLARDTAMGVFDRDLVPIFGRFQINGYEDSYCVGVTDLSLDFPVEFILQCRSEEDLLVFADHILTMGRASVLFDPSGGRGLAPFAWPVAPPQTKIGFAGGINPENVEAVIGEIVAANPTLPSFWIDMESGVRTDDRLDLAKVRDVCRRVVEINRRISG